MAGKGTKNNQQNAQGEAQSEQVKQTQPLDFDVRIQSIKPSDAIKGRAVWKLWFIPDNHSCKSLRKE